MQYLKENFHQTRIVKKNSIDMRLLTRESILHPTAAQRMLERRAHESVAIARALENLEVDGKHGHVENERDSDETDSSSEEVLGE